MNIQRSLSAAIWSLSLVLAGNVALYAQHEHASTETPAVAPSTVISEEMEHIFCPTMKTGQLCSHGTAATLQIQGEKVDAWVAMARKFDRAVNTATEQLFTDAETILDAEQMAELKAWFAIGMNPQINELLYAKGLGQPMKPAADGDADAAGADSPEMK